MGMELDGKDMEQGEHFPTQENNRNDRYGDRQDLAEIEAAAARFKTPRHQAQNIQGCEAKNQHPEDVVNIVFLAWRTDRTTGIGKLKHEEQHRLQGHQARPQPYCVR